MVRKKSVKKSVGNSTKKKSAKKNKKSKKFVFSTERKLDISLKNFSFFLMLFLIFMVFYKISSLEIYQNLFYLLALVFGFISISFLVVVLIFVFLKFIKK